MNPILMALMGGQQGGGEEMGEMAHGQGGAQGGGICPMCGGPLPAGGQGQPAPQGGSQIPPEVLMQLLGAMGDGQQGGGGSMSVGGGQMPAM